LRLKVYAEKAQQEGYKQIARLFRVIAFSEKFMVKGLRVLKEIKSTEENLAAVLNRKQKLPKLPTINL